ncbi:MAG: lipoyl(octanoyl) transferase [Candidatus Arcticimaribacter sp.]|nr:MAG: lipoyl(octanoyl) transferase [Candidatus Arcticimaribacter sp.]
MQTPNKKIQVTDLNNTSYQPAWDFQEKLLKEIVDLKIANRKIEIQHPTPNYFLWVEHPPVITLGKSGAIDHLLLNEEQLRDRGIEYYKTNRGGDITFHGPGQVVGYPILDLENFFTDIHKYLRLLEEMVILTLKEYGLEGTRSPGETGVWLDVGTPFARKICAMGVKASRWVTMHGFAFNVNTDLAYFSYIVPCGIQGKGVTSLQAELKREIPLDEVREKLSTHFQALFDAEFIRAN